MIYRFEVDMTCRGYGFVEADSIEEAKEKIINEEYDDIYEHADFEPVKVLIVEEEEEENDG